MKNCTSPTKAQNRIFKLSKIAFARLNILCAIFLITFFASNKSFSQPLKPGQTVVTSFDPVNPLYNSVKVMDLRNKPPFVVGGNFWAPATFAGADWNQSKMGNVFGITLDDQNPPNIYVSRSTVYCGTPDTLVGLIYKIDRLTWSVTNYIVKNPVAGPPLINVNSIPNTGPGLGNLCFDNWHQQIFTTNHEDGKIYRIKTVGAVGNVLSVYDPFTIDAGTNSGFVARGERVWGIGVFGTSSTDVRVYYSRWVNDRFIAAANSPNEIWSVALDNTGDYVSGSARLEITMPVLSTQVYSNPVSDIEFSQKGTMLIGERTMFGDMGPCVADGYWAHQSRILEFPRTNLGFYNSNVFNFHRVGISASPWNGFNSAGGVDYDYGIADSLLNTYSQCDSMIAGTGDYLYNKPLFGLIYGVQFSARNAAGSPNKSHYIDLNGIAGTGDKNSPGDIDVYRRDSCSSPVTGDLYIKDCTGDVGIEPDVNCSNIMWASPDIWVCKSNSSCTVQENPEYNTPTSGLHNYVRVTVRNKSTTTTSSGGVLSLQWSKASTALSWGKPWDGSVTTPVDPMGGLIGTQYIPAIAPNGSTILTFTWDPPNPANYLSNFNGDKGHFCLLARIETSAIAPYGMTTAETTDLFANVKNNKKIAWKNVEVYDRYSDSGIAFYVGNSGPAAIKKFEFADPTGGSLFNYWNVSIKLENTLYQKWVAGGKQGFNITELSDSTIEVTGIGSYITNLNLPANSIFKMNIKTVRNFNSDSVSNPDYNIDVIQHDVSLNRIDGGNRFNLKPNCVLNLKLFIEGFYYSGKMVPDTVSVTLRNSTSPFAVVDSAKSLLDASGNGTFNFKNASNGVGYYIDVKHRNAVETWSRTPQHFTSSLMNYDFTTSANKAYGNNMILTGGVYSIFSGDVNQDQVIDAADLSQVENDAIIGFIGYVNTDVNGDDFVDANDLSIVDNNSSSGIYAITP
ncbi:MAG: hypothetical protein WAU38_10400 [Ignavibacteria bacterium]|nr:hypothetical protein [Ignavibacteria bacterium]